MANPNNTDPSYVSNCATYYSGGCLTCSTNNSLWKNTCVPYGQVIINDTYSSFVVADNCLKQESNQCTECVADSYMVKVPNKNVCCPNGTYYNIKFGVCTTTASSYTKCDEVDIFRGDFPFPQCYTCKSNYVNNQGYCCLATEYVDSKGVCTTGASCSLIKNG